MFFRTPYNYDTDIASFKSGLDCSNDSGRTQQHMKNECDINNLVKTFARTGVIPGADLPATEFAFDEVFDFQTAMNAVRSAEESFATLPATLRERFRNDPQRFLQFVHDDKNYDEAISMGLVTKKEATPVLLNNPPTSPNSGDNPTKEP